MALRAPDLAELVALVAAAQLRSLARRAPRGPQRPSWSLRTELAAATMRAVVMRSKRRGVQRLA